MLLLAPRWLAFRRYNKVYGAPTYLSTCLDGGKIPFCPVRVRSIGFEDVGGGVMLGTGDSRLWEAPRVKCLSFVWTGLDLLL